nr:MAG: MC160L [Molluscum contagiosum virus]
MLFQLIHSLQKVKIESAHLLKAMAHEPIPFSFLRNLLAELDASEHEVLRFLCRDVAPASKTAEDALRALQRRRLLTLSSMAELLCALRRFDVLKVRFGMTRECAGRLLGHGFLSQYRLQVASINNMVEGEELRVMCLCAGKLLPPNCTPRCLVELVTALEDAGALSPQDVSVLVTLLHAVCRYDLSVALSAVAHGHMTVGAGTPVQDEPMDVLEVADAEPMEATPACDEIGIVHLAGGASAACTSADEGADLTDSEPEDPVFAAEPVYADVDLSMFARADAAADSAMFVNAVAGTDSSFVNAEAGADSSMFVNADASTSSSLVHANTGTDLATSDFTDSETEDSAGPACAAADLSIFGHAESMSSLLLRTKASY